MFVEALVAQAAVEALDKAVLHGLARCDQVPANGALLLVTRLNEGGFRERTPDLLKRLVVLERALVAAKRGTRAERPLAPASLAHLSRSSR